MNILLISGSVQEQSHTRALTEEIAKQLSLKDVAITHWNVKEKPLPIMDPALRDSGMNHPDSRVSAFVKKANEADGFVFASPIYHNSYSGVLKNALDHLGSAYFANKAVGLASHGGNGSPQAVDHLRLVTRSVKAIAIPTNICTASSDYTDYQITNEKVLTRINSFCNELMLFAKMMKQVREEELLEIKRK